MEWSWARKTQRALVGQWAGQRRTSQAGFRLVSWPDQKSLNSVSFWLSSRATEENTHTHALGLRLFVFFAVCRSASGFASSATVSDPRHVHLRTMSILRGFFFVDCHWFIVPDEILFFILFLFFQPFLEIWIDELLASLDLRHWIATLRYTLEAKPFNSPGVLAI